MGHEHNRRLISRACAACLPFLVFAQAPRIDSLSPDQGPIAGGTEVIIRGAHLDDTRVSVDFTPIAPSVSSGEELRFVMPPHDNGYAILRIASPLGTATARFLYLPPPLRDLPAGYITTIAGIGSYFGDYGPAREAVLSPFALAHAGDGSFYLAEPSHVRVLRFRPGGLMEPFAGGSPPGDSIEGDGGPALNARLGFPRSVFVENSGDVVIADGPQNVVWRVEAATGIVRIIAGTGEPGFSGDGGPARSARLSSVSHLTGDGNGTIWFIDFRNMRIRRITPDGAIDTVCGTGVPGFSGDGGPALQAQFDTGVDDYGALAYDSAGFLYLADEANHRIRRIDLTTGIISTFLSQGSRFGMTGLRALLVDPSGDLYFSASGVIYRVSRAGALREQFGVFGARASPPTLDGTPFARVQPGNVVGLALDPDGNLLYSDSEIARVFRLNRSLGMLETVAGMGPGLPGDGGSALSAVIERNGQAYADLAALPGGDLLYSGPRIRRIDLDGRISIFAGNGYNSKVEEGAPAIDTSHEFAGIETDSEGNVYAATFASIVHIDPLGILRILSGLKRGCGFSGDGGPARDAELCQPFDVVRDRDGNLLVADTNNNRVRRIDAATRFISTIAGTGPTNGFEIWRKGGYCGDGGPASEACLNGPAGLAVGPDGELLISEFRHIRKVDPAGVISTLASPPTGAFSYLTFDAAGNAYTSRADAVVRITPDGVEQFLAARAGSPRAFSGDGGPASKAQVDPAGAGITIDHEGNLIFVDGINRRIRAIRYGAVLIPPDSVTQALSGSLQTTTVSTPFPEPLSVLVLNGNGNPAGNVRVDFTAPDEGASCSFVNQKRSVSVLTDRRGIASAACTANGSAGPFAVAAIPLGSTASLEFSLVNTQP